ncbi:MAG: PAS domain S-box protein, partial [Chloroflexota bacterium]
MANTVSVRTTSPEARQLLDAIGRAALKMAGSLDCDETARSLLRTAQSALRADTVLLWRADVDRRLLYLHSWCGAPESELDIIQEISFDANLYTTKAAREKKAQVIEEIEFLPPENPMASQWRNLGFRSLVVLPLQACGRLVGVMAYLARTRRSYSKEEMATINAIATILGMGLENARLASELERATRESRESAEMLEALQGISEATLSGLSMEELLHVLLVRTRDALSGDTATLLLVTQDGRNLVVRASVGMDEAAKWVTVPVGEGFAGRIAATREPLIADNLSGEDEVSSRLCKKAHSMIGAPMMLHGRLIGVIQVGTKRVRHFTESDLRLLQLIADRIASAIRRAEIEERSTHLASIVETSQDAIIDMDPDGNITSWSPGAERVYGYRIEDVKGKHLSFLAPKDRQDDVGSLLKRLRSGECVGPLETVQLRKDGAWIDISLTGSPLKGRSGRIEGVAIIARDITVRKRTEQALRASERLLRQFVEHAPAAVAMFDREMRYLLASRRWLTDYHLDGRDIIGLSHYEVFPDIPQRWKEAHQRALSGCVERCEEDCFERADGKVEWIRWELRPWWDAQGRVGGITMFTEVITERKQAEQQLKEANAELQAVFQALPDLYFRLDSEGAYLDVKAGRTADLFVPKEKLLGKRVHDVLPPEAANILRNATEKAIQTDTLITQEYSLLLPQGEQVFEARILPFLKGQVIAVVRNVTERKRAEAERERYMAELDATISSIVDGVMVVGLKGEIVRMNAAGKRIFGISADERRLSLEQQVARVRVETADGKPFPLEDMPMYRALHRQTVTGIQVVIHPRPSETVWLSTSAAPIQTEDGRLLGAVVTFSDITGLHELQEQQEDLVRTVSHDLRTPLTSIIGQAQIIEKLLEKTGQDGDLKRNAASIVTGGRRMNAMIQDLVDMARLESGQFKLDRVPIDLCDYLSDLKGR